MDARLESKLGFDRIRERIADRCSTEYAAARTAAEEFSTDAAQIRERLNLTDEMRLILMFEDSFPTTGYIDAIPFLQPLLKEGSSMDVLSLGKLRTMLETTRRIVAFFTGVKDSVYPNLKQMAKGIDSFPDVQRKIDSIIDRYGDVKDSASQDLFEIRRSLKEKENSLSKRAAAILRRAQEEGISDSDATVNVRDGKFLIPVNTASKRKMQGFVYDESASGKTTFIEPAEIVELENDILELQFAQTREIARIIREFSDFLRPYVPDLLEGARFIGETDFLMAKAQTALDMIAGMPVISEDGSMSLRKARHPLLEKALKKEGRQIVPISIFLTPQKRILLISGPNAGGKSVCLKTTGLLQYMFQWGMLIPTSESSELPVFDRIIVSIGDDQSLENDLSTYSSFLADMRDMLSNADARTLVLIDEFGSGTEPAAGGAIAEAILAEIDSRGVYGVITTHYTNLKLYASGADTGVVNGAMLYDSSRIEPMFKLEIGMPGNSFAFELARKMRLPESIVKDAESRAGDEFVGMERNLRRIARGRRVLDEKIQKIKATDRTLEGLTDRYQKELESIKKERKDILEDARREAESIVKGAGKQVEKTIRDIKEAQADKERTKQARTELQGFMQALEQRKAQEKKSRDEYLDRKLSELEKRQRKLKKGPDAAEKEEKARQDEFRNAPLKIGEKVRVKQNGMVGEVVRITNQAVTLTIGNISSKMPVDRVERISSNEYKDAVKKFSKPVYESRDAAITQRKLNFSPEIDVRGARLQEAVETVARYVDDAMMLSMGSVRIIHGKGTGVLREELQKYLRSVRGIASVQDEDIRLGGTGVTIVTFD